MPASYFIPTSINITACTVAEIGFLQNYSFTEGIEHDANLTLNVVSGSIGRDVVISFRTQSADSARSKLYKWYQLTL